MGDCNSVVGDASYRNTVGPHGLGSRNQRGKILINFHEINGLVITNTWFQKPKRRLYTCKAPGDQSQHQVDHIFVKHRFRNSMKAAQTIAGADIDFEICALLGYNTVSSGTPEESRSHQHRGGSLKSQILSLTTT
jgi:hypothetical protein